MSPRRRKQLLGVWVVTLVVLLVLIGALPGLTLLPERAYEFPRRDGPARYGLDLTWLFGVVLAIYVIGLILLAPRILRKGLAYLMIALGMLALFVMALIVLAAWISGEPELIGSLPEASPTSALSQESTPEPELPAVEAATFQRPPRWVGTIITIGIGLMLAAGLLGALWWFALRCPDARQQPLVELAARAQAALDALYGGEEASQVVLRCYFEMMRVLDQTQGIRRAEAMTPREFADRLTGLGLPAPAVWTLTRLFEDARYGTPVSDDAVAQQAVASLKVIVDACQEAA